VEASALHHPVGLGRLSVAGPLLRLRTDDQLVALFRAGHDEAFGTIHDRYRQRLYGYARQMLGGSRSDAEDVLQDVFLRTYHALRADDRPVTVRAWLYRVAHNRCIDQLRRPAPAAADIYDLNRGLNAEPESEAERREDLRRLVADVQRLPEQQRSALLMREMEGLSYTDLAGALGVTVPAVKSLLVRARVGLVEAVEARDTACVEIRTDLAAAFDRGVRASGRSRKHLRECAGCRDYRSAMRAVDKQLNGLAPASGPRATLAKLLGIGGAGSGAAAGGGVAVVGCGGGAAAVGSGAASLGTGAVAATATKVAAVMAAAAVVGGGAATVEKVERRHTAPPSANVVVRQAPAPGLPAADPQRRVDRAPIVRHAVAAPALVDGAVKAPHAVARLDDPGTPVESSTTAAPKYEPTTGGLVAPEETSAPTTAAADGTGSAPTTPAATGTEGAAGAPAAPTTTSQTAAQPGSAPATAPGTGGAAAPSSTASAPSAGGPSGQTSAGAGGSPIAQGAASGTP
jgi:RNA polymerase sigma factor (sigma-70 family)